MCIITVTVYTYFCSCCVFGSLEMVLAYLQHVSWIFEKGLRKTIENLVR